MKPLKWHRVTTGVVASSVRTAREYKIYRSHRSLFAPKLQTYTAFTRALPADAWEEIDWTVRMRDAKRLCQKREGRS